MTQITPGEDHASVSISAASDLPENGKKSYRAKEDIVARRSILRVLTSEVTGLLVRSGQEDSTSAFCCAAGRFEGTAID